MAGLLDSITEDQLLGGLLGAGAASGAKGNFLARMAAGIGAGERFSQGRREEARQRSQDEMRAEYQKLMNMKMQRDAQQAAAAQAQEQQLSDLAKKHMQPAMPGMGGFNDSLPPEMQVPSVSGKPAGFNFQGYAIDLAGINPQKSWEMLQALKPKREIITGKPGDVFFDKGDMSKPLGSVPEKAEKPPTSVQEFLYGQKNPAFNAWDQSRKKAAATNVSVSSVTKQEGEEAKAVGKFFGDAYADIQKAGFGAQSKINRYTRLGSLLDGVNTGKFAATGLEVAKAASALGLNIDPNMANKEAAQSLSSEIALELRNPSGGAGMPGAMSDADRQFLANMVPGLATTPDGRKLMMETAIKLAERDKQVAHMAREYRKKNGSIKEGFYDELAQFSAQNPLFRGAPSQSNNVDALVNKYRSK